MSDLRGYTAPEPVDPGNTGKIFGAVIVALAVCAAGAYTYETGMWNTPTVRVADNDLPSVPTLAPRMIAPPPTAPVQSVPAPQPAPQAVAPTQPVETPRPQHILAQHSQRTIAPQAPTVDQIAPPDIAPPAPAQAAPDTQTPPDAPVQTPQQQPDGSNTPQ